MKSNPHPGQFNSHHSSKGLASLATGALDPPLPWEMVPGLPPILLSSLLATVCFLRAFYYLAPLVSDLVAFLSSRINSFSCTPLLPLR